MSQVYRPSEAMDWPGKNKPEAEPGCGFLNEHCPKDDTHLRSIVAAGVLAVLLFCAAVITMSIYRRWKIEQEIEGLLWKIDPSEIHGYPHLDNMMSSPSKVRAPPRRRLRTAISAMRVHCTYFLRVAVKFS